MSQVFSSAYSFIKESNVPSLHVISRSTPYSTTTTSYFAEGLEFITRLNKERTMHEAKMYRQLAEAGDSIYAIQEGFDDIFGWIKDFVKKVINFFKKLLAKFWVRLNSLIGRDKYIEKHKSQLNKFGSEHEFKIKGFKYTFKPNIPNLHPIQIAKDHLEDLCEVASGAEKDVLHKTAYIKQQYEKFLEDKLGSSWLNKERAQIIEHVTNEIDSADWKDELFEVYRDGDRNKSEIEVTSAVVQESLMHFTNYEKIKHQVEKERDNVEKEYNVIKKRYDNLAQHCSKLASAKNYTDIDVYDFVDATEDWGDDEKQKKHRGIDKTEYHGKDRATVINQFATTLAAYIEEVSNIHTMAFTAKLDALRDRFTQDKSILYGAFKKILSKESMFSTEAYVIDDENHSIPIQEVAEMSIDYQNLTSQTASIRSRLSPGFVRSNEGNFKYGPTRADEKQPKEMTDENKYGYIPANWDPYMREKYYKDMVCCESRYCYYDDWAYENYKLEAVIDSVRLRGFSDMLVAYHEDASYGELQVIQEGVTDKIKKVWESFKAFLNKIWEKFKQYMFRLIENDKEYLERYRNQILNIKPKDYSFNMPNYAEGIQKMYQTTVPSFANEVESIPTSEEDQSYTLEKKILPNYNGDPNWDDALRDYFQGGDESKQYNLQDMNMTSLYNFCHDWKTSTLPSIQKDIDTFQKNYTAIEKKINDLEQKEKTAAANTVNKDTGKGETPTAPAGGAKPTTGGAPTAPDNGQKPVTGNKFSSITIPSIPKGEAVSAGIYTTRLKEFNAAEKSLKTARTELDKATPEEKSTQEWINKDKEWTAANKNLKTEKGNLKTKVEASALISSTYQSFFHEEITGGTSGDDNNKNTPNLDPNNAANKSVTTGATNKIKTMRSLTGTADQQQDIGQVSKEVTEATNQLKHYNRVYGAVLKAKQTVCQEMYKDYMTLIKKHVADVVGQSAKDVEIRAAQADSAAGGANQRLNYDRIEAQKRLTAIEDAEKIANPQERQKKMEEELNILRAANPNFAGNLATAKSVLSNIINPQQQPGE